jgi:hypothetical protein
VANLEPGWIMENQRDLVHFFDALVDMNRQTFAGGHYEIAYHLLAAAMHCAEDLQDGQRLLELQQKAIEQGNWIDKHDNGHRLSSLHARARGTDPLFASLARTIESKRLTLKVNQQVQHLHPGVGQAFLPD